MVDIHSHIIWEVDDGAADIEESLLILEAAWQSGTTDIVVTPHLNGEFRYQAELTEQRAAELTARVAGKPRIHRGCEVHLNLDNIEQVLQSPASYTINGTQYLLVELPHGQVGRHIDAVLEHLLAEGISPIVAHPERNPVLQKKPHLLEGWVELGCLLQLTALSVTGGFGRPAKAASAWLLQRGLAHVVASDAHDPVRRHPRLEAAYSVVSSRYGTDYADALFRDNPRNIVDGAPVARGRQTFEVSSPRWWRFWQHK
jgi:protein-tyrosine phosphatase